MPKLTKPTTWAEWEMDGLQSASEHPEGIVEVWEAAGAISRLISMQLRGLIDRRDGLRGGPWIITPAGRAALAQASEGGVS